MFSSPARLPGNPTSSWLPSALALALASMLMLGAAVFDASPVVMIGAVGALGIACFVLLNPFVGLVGVVAGTQVTGLVEKLVPKVGDIALEALAGLVILGVLLQSYKSPRGERFGPNALPLRLAGLLLLVLLVSTLFAENRGLALSGLQKRVNLLLLFWLVCRMAGTFGRLRTLIVAFVLATFLSTGLSIFGYVTGHRVVVPDPTKEVEQGRARQVGAASQNATYASRMMLAGTAMAAMLALRSKRRRRLFAIATAVGAMGTLLTLSRSTSIVMVLGGVWFLWKIRKHRRIPLILTATLLSGALAMTFMPAFYWERVSELSEPGEDPTLGRRLGYHLIGLDLLQSHPLFGVGPDNYQIYYQDFDYRFMPGRFLEPRDLHNMYLSVTVEGGLLAGFLFLSMIASAVVGVTIVCRRLPGSEIAVLAETMQFGVVLFLLSSIFGAVETNKVFWVLMGLSTATFVVARKTEGWVPKNGVHP